MQPDDDVAVSLPGGVGNAGAVVRIGDTVRRPPTAHSPAVRRIVQHLEAVGFDRAQRFLGVDEQGRDVFTYVEGDVPLPPFPGWAQTADVLREVATLLRDFHGAMSSFEPGDGWSSELADPAGGPVLCHNDVCPENVVFRDGRAVALLDFDVAAPGRRAWDVARTARLWVPVGAPGAGLTWPGELDVHERLRVFTAAYGLDRDELETFVPTLLVAVRQGQDWVRSKVRTGEPSFVAMWNRLRLQESFEADAMWLVESQQSLAESISRPAPD